MVNDPNSNKKCIVRKEDLNLKRNNFISGITDNLCPKYIPFEKIRNRFYANKEVRIKY